MHEWISSKLKWLWNWLFVKPKPHEPEWKCEKYAKPKKKFETASEAKKFIGNDKKLKLFPCQHCGGWHLTTSNVGWRRCEVCSESFKVTPKQYESPPPCCKQCSKQRKNKKRRKNRA